MDFVNPLHEAAAALGLRRFADSATWADDLTAAGVICKSGDITQLSRHRAVRPGLALPTNNSGIYSNTLSKKVFFQILPDGARATGGRDDTYWPPNARPAVEARALPAQLRARANAFIKADTLRRRQETERRASRPKRGRSPSPVPAAAPTAAPAPAPRGVDMSSPLLCLDARR